VNARAHLRQLDAGPMQRNVGRRPEGDDVREREMDLIAANGFDTNPGERNLGAMLVVEPGDQDIAGRNANDTFK
jgi:hypothetical protein